MRILLVHDSATVQKLIHHYFATEIADSYVRAADSTEATSWLRSQKFDLILCGAGTRRMNVQAMHESLPGTANWDTPFVAVFPRGAPEQAERLRQMGIVRHLLVPILPEEIGALLGTLYNPRARRGAQRFAMQGTEAVLDLGGVEASASLVNISVSGLLCEHDLPPTTTEIFKTPLLTFTFPREYGGGKVGGVRVALLRLQVMTWTAASHATRVRTAWRFSNMPDASATVLHQGLAQVQRHLEHAEAELKAPA